MSEVEKRAREAIQKACGVNYAHERSIPGCDICAHMDRAIEALSAAGLLVTDLHERALVACKQMAESGVFINSKGNEEAFRIGREALAAEKPKKKWHAVGRTLCGQAVTWMTPSPAYAEAAAAALNAVDAEGK